MSKRHDTRGSFTKGKANASPFAVGANITKKNPKAAATTKLQAVSGSAFYANATAGSSKKAKPQLRPQDFPSPTDHSADAFEADQEVIDVDPGESEEEIEDVSNVTEVTPALSARASMAPNASRHQGEKPAVVDQAQTVKSASTKLQPKSRGVGGKGKSVSDSSLRSTKSTWLLIMTCFDRRTQSENSVRKRNFRTSRHFTSTSILSMQEMHVDWFSHPRTLD